MGKLDEKLAYLRKTPRRRAPVKTKAKSMPPHVVTVSEQKGDELFRTSKGVADGVVTRARVNRLNYKVMLMDASSDFKAYADPKIDTLAGQITANELLRPMLTWAFGIVGGEIGKKIGDSLSGLIKAVAEDIGKRVVEAGGSIVSAAAFPVKDDVTGLKQGIQVMVNTARAAADRMSDVVIESIEKPMQEVAKQAAAKKPWSEDQARLLKAFLDKDLESTLEAFGVPTGATATALQDRIYEGLIHQFEKKLIVGHLREEGRSYNEGDNADRYKLEEAAAYNTKVEMERRKKERAKGS